MKQIIIKGAREHNLKNIDLEIERNKITCFVGVSGSGKSTIAFDIIAKEGQRQYFESLSSYARRYLHKSNRPDVDIIKGISSSIIIAQDKIHVNPRSTVGTITETYTYLRLLYSRVGYPVYDSSYFSFNHPLGACPRCKGLGKAMDIDISKLIDIDKSLNEGAILYSNWRVGSMAWKIIESTGYFDMNQKLKDYKKEDLDRLLYGKKEVVEGFKNNVIHWTYKGIVTHLLSRGTSTYRTVSTDEVKYFKYMLCPECNGDRLRAESLAVKINSFNIGEVANMPICKAIDVINKINHRNASAIKPRLVEQLQFLIDAGVGYLSLNRSTDTLSGGEAQRVKLARQLGCDLIETIYVLDEPTAGLHPRDIEAVIKNLRYLKRIGNTVLVVEHDRDVILSCDNIIEIGPGGGRAGGEIIFNGSISEMLKSEKSLTAKYLNENKKLSCNLVNKRKLRELKEHIKIVNAHRHNLKNLNVDIPLGVFTCLTGVSGAGKSSLIEELIDQYREKIVLIGQEAVGNNKRGSIATYIGVFDQIRKLFADANHKGIGLFSANSTGGCDECKGLGFIEMDMNFLGDVKMKCERCQGKRYKKEVLEYTFNGLNISEVLALTGAEAKDFFLSLEQSSTPAISQIVKQLELLNEVGLDYIELGQSIDTLSGGESQRLKLINRMKRKGEFYILDEPTSGLHFADIEKLMHLIDRLVDLGNSVLVIEHNLEIISKADYIIDLGPEGGDEGGYVIAKGTPEEICKVKESYTGKYLEKHMNVQGF